MALTACAEGPGGGGATATPPVFVSLPQTSAQPGLRYEYRVVARDARGRDAAIRVVDLPSWLSIAASADGSSLISGTPLASDAGAHRVVLEAVDEVGLTGRQAFSIVVEAIASNVAPVVLSVPADLTVGANTPLVLSLGDHFADPNGDDLRFRVDGLPASLTVDGDSGEVRGVPRLEDFGEVPLTVTAIDPAGLRAETSFVLEIARFGGGDPRSNRRYAPLPEGWEGRGSGFAGMVEVSAGETIYTDYLYDDTGARGSAQSPLPELGGCQSPVGGSVGLGLANRSRLFLECLAAAATAGDDGEAPAAGTYEYPLDEARFGGNAADLAELRFERRGDRLHLLARLNTLIAPDTTVVAIALDTRPGPSSLQPWPFNARLSSPGTEHVLTLHASGGFLDAVPLSEVDGWLQVDPQLNTLEASLPLVQLGGATRFTAYAAAGLWDSVAGNWQDVASSASNAVPGGRAANVTTAANAFNAAFRGQETGAFLDGLQSEALRLGDLSAFGQVIDLDSADTAPLHPTGYRQRIYRSSVGIGPGEGVGVRPVERSGGEFNYFGFDQPYMVYVPTNHRGVALFLHGAGGNFNSWIDQPGTQAQVGDEGQRLLVSPLGRGKAANYTDEGMLDPLQALTDAQDWWGYSGVPAALFGHSMGGAGALRLLATHPDRFVVAALSAPGVGGTNEPGRGGAARSLVQNFSDLPLLLTHGLIDPIVTYDQSLELVDLFEANQNHYRFLTYPLHEHTSFPAFDDWTVVKDWFGQAGAPARPARVRFSTSEAWWRPDLSPELVFDRAWWVSSLRLCNPGGLETMGTVDAVSHALRSAPPTLTAHRSFGTAPTPFVATGRDAIPGGAGVRQNGLTARLRNVGQIRLDLAEMGLRTDLPLEVTVETDCPTAVELSGYELPPEASPLPDGVNADDGSTFSISPGTHTFLLPAVAAGPVAEAGSDRSIAAGLPQLLDGSASRGGAGRPIVQWRWRQLSGPPVVLEGRRSAVARFVAQSAAVLEFELQVIDAAGEIARDTVTLFAGEQACAAPPLRAGDAGDNTLDSAGTGQMFERIEVRGITDLSEKPGTGGVALVDLNRDGLVDIFIQGDVGEPTEVTQLFLNRGCFRFEQQPLRLSASDGGALPTGNHAIPVFADFNDDGLLDYFLTRNNSRNSLFMARSTAYDFEDVAPPMGVDSPGTYARQAVVGDVNGDGFLDIAVGGEQIGSRVDIGTPQDRLYVYREPAAGQPFEAGRFVDLGDPGDEVELLGLIDDFGGPPECDSSDQATSPVSLLPTPRSPDLQRAIRPRPAHRDTGSPGIMLRDMDDDGDLDLLQSAHVDMNLSTWNDACANGEWRHGVWLWQNLLRDTGTFGFRKQAEGPLSLTEEGYSEYDPNRQVYLPLKHAVSHPYLNTADVDNDGDLDVVTVGATDPEFKVGTDFIAGKAWRNLGGLRFAPVTEELGLGPLNWTYNQWGAFWNAEIPLTGELQLTACAISNQKPLCAPLTFGEHQFFMADTVFGDYDNDGDLDLLVADRHEVGSAWGVMRNMLFMNQGGRFEPVATTISGIDTNVVAVETADLNGDGLLDFYFNGDPGNSFPIYRDIPGYLPLDRLLDKVYWNTGAFGARDNHWVKIRLSGLPSGQRVGARLFLHAAGDRSPAGLMGRRDYSPVDSYKTSHELEVHFGLGKQKKISLRVELPNGETRWFDDIPHDRLVNIALDTNQVAILR